MPAYQRIRNFLGLVLTQTFVCLPAFADHPADSDSRDAKPGHSVNADAFNDGPRQAAYLMNGMGNVHFEISTKNPMAQRFFDQGIVQLHGFWYFEAERSFRQAAAFDADCPILYWGMARANIENAKRSRGFIDQAVSRIAKANDKEKRLIEAWNNRVKVSGEDAAKSKEDPKSKEDTAKDKAADNSKAAEAKKRDDEKKKKDDKDRLKKYVAELEQVANDYPEDIELKAMLALQYWQNGEVQSHTAIDAILSDIFRVNPRHPAHHFRIHLWDGRKEKLALDAAAKCGQSAPGIAHMWHMPGHTYSRLHRYADAAWQQEASARVDHAHMVRDQVMPDQIHNYAHNNEWLIRDLIFLGRVNAATDLAKNMIELPRHPKYNKFSGRGSASLGRERLLGVLTSYQLWPQLIELSNSAYIEPTDDELRQDEHKAWMTIAEYNVGNTTRAKELHAELNSQINTLRTKVNEGQEALRLLIEKEQTKPNENANRPPKLLEAYDQSDDPFGDENDPTIAKVPSKDIPDAEMKDWSKERKENAIALRKIEHRLGKIRQFESAVIAYQAAHEGRFKEALARSNECRSIINSMVRMEWLAEAGHPDKALDRIEKRIQEGKGELIPLATGVWIASKNDLKDIKVQERCKKMIEALSPIAAGADANLVLLERIEPVVAQLGMKDKWKTPPEAPTDVGDRPSLDSLGPFRWSPSQAPVWSAPGSDGELKSTKHFAQKPLVLILYLGFGCVHCAEQLKEFSPMVKQYQKAGIEVAAISSETLSKLQLGLKNYDGEMNVPLIANPELDIFKEFRCFDDFEGTALHGTFLIDANNRIRWQDIGFEPFMDSKFLLEESIRLLKLK
jgi:peroxiredoxin